MMSTGQGGAGVGEGGDHHAKETTEHGGECTSLGFGFLEFRRSLKEYL